MVASLGEERDHVRFGNGGTFGGFQLDLGQRRFGYLFFGSMLNENRVPFDSRFDFGVELGPVIGPSGLDEGAPFLHIVKVRRAFGGVAFLDLKKGSSGNAELFWRVRSRT
jgi:hypothetical protein